MSVIEGTAFLLFVLMFVKSCIVIIGPYWTTAFLVVVLSVVQIPASESSESTRKSVWYVEINNSTKTRSRRAT